MADLEQAGHYRIDPETLPDLHVLTGVFGSRADGPRFDAEDDNHAVLMPCLFPFIASD